MKGPNVSWLRREADLRLVLCSDELYGMRATSVLTFV